MNEIKLLFERLDNFAYPDNMKLVKGEIVGEAFFPGGRGLINTNDNTISDKKIMILGQDFDCETNFEISKENGKEDIVKNPTWRNLTKVLNELEISLDNCSLPMQSWAFEEAIKEQGNHLLLNIPNL